MSRNWNASWVSGGVSPTEFRASGAWIKLDPMPLRWRKADLFWALDHRRDPEATAMWRLLRWQDAVSWGVAIIGVPPKDVQDAFNICLDTQETGLAYQLVDDWYDTQLSLGKTAAEDVISNLQRKFCTIRCNFIRY